MLPDEVLRMDNRECLVLLRGQNPLKLCKIKPNEHPSFKYLHDVRIADYTPEWRRWEESAKPAASASSPVPRPEPPAPSAGPVPAGQTQRAAQQSDPQPGPEQFTRQEFDYGLLDMEPDGQDTQPPDTDAPYGAFDLIETLPEDVGGP